MRFHDNAIFKKRLKIYKKSIRVRISIRPSEDFAFFSLLGGLRIDLGRPGAARNSPRLPFWLPEGSLRPPGRPPESPWDTSGTFRGRYEKLLGRPGTFRDALRRSRGALGTLPVRPGDVPRHRNDLPGLYLHIPRTSFETKMCFQSHNLLA